MSKMYFTSESVSEGHPDKVADQISDAILDAYLTIDPNSHVAVETMVTTQTVVISGEVNSYATVNHKKVVKHVLKHIGYDKPFMGFSVDGITIIDLIHEQSPDIDRGVSKANEEEQGAGDQGIMFGYATNESDNYMPLTIDLSHRIVKALADIRREGKVMTYLRPDAKSQVTIEYDDGKPVRIATIVVSTQHDEFASDTAMQETIRKDVLDIVIPRVISEIRSYKVKELFNDDIVYHINPTGKFVVGGPNGDTGVTGRKIIVDTYGGWGAHGGGAFSGKDPSKVDRSAAYAARHIAKNLVAVGMADRMLIQLSYAIGVAEPVSIFVNTYGTAKNNVTDSEIADYIKRTIDLRPASIIKRFRLFRPIYSQTAAYGHFGKENLPWEQLDWDIQV